MKRITMRCAFGLVLLLALGTVAGAKVPVEMWLYCANQSQVEWAQQFEVQFNATHPNIVLSLSPALGNLRRDQLIVASAAGVGPDIYNDSLNVTGEYYTNGVAAPLDQYLNLVKGMDGFLPGIVDVLKFNGRLYALPILVYPRFDLYNLDAFAEAGVQEPKTWDEMVTAARRLKRVADDGSLVRFGYRFQGGTVFIRLFDVPCQLLFIIRGPAHRIVRFGHSLSPFRNRVHNANQPCVIFELPDRSQVVCRMITRTDDAQAQPAVTSHGVQVSSRTMLLIITFPLLWPLSVIAV
jgi:hypothetical protein